MLGRDRAAHLPKTRWAGPRKYSQIGFAACYDALKSIPGLGKHGGKYFHLVAQRFQRCDKVANSERLSR